MNLGTNTGPELLLEIDRTSRLTLRAQLEARLREAVRSGRLATGTRLPASRALAHDLGVSRRLIVDVYAQLLAEGYLRTRPGGGTFVADAGATSPIPAPGPPPARLSLDFFPGNPDLSGFPRGPWLRALRAVVRGAPDRALGYPDPAGAPELRRALAGHLGRVRGVVADTEAIIVCSGAAQALALIARALGGAGIAVEDPCLPQHRAILAGQGARLAALGVDGDGARVQDLERATGAGRRVSAVLVTPAHQAPTGVALAPARRARLLAWATQTGGLVIEDDYDAEFRYDRAPLAAMQGLAPAQVAYLGTVSKTLAPALRIGWMVLPAALRDRVLSQRAVTDHGCPTIDQLALAHLLESGEYDRHLRQARRRYRARRDALAGAVAEHLPGATVTGLAAGLHALVRLNRDFDGPALMRAASRRSVGVYPLGLSYAEPRPVHDGLILGYANLAEPAIAEGIRRLSLALGEIDPPPDATNEGWAIAR